MTTNGLNLDNDYYWQSHSPGNTPTLEGNSRRPFGHSPFGHSPLNRGRVTPLTNEQANRERRDTPDSLDDMFSRLPGLPDLSSIKIEVPIINNLHLAKQLSQAASAGDLSKVKHYRSEGADPNRLIDGMNAMHMAAANGHHYVLKYLIDNGGEVNSFTTLNKTPVMFAAENGHYDALYLLGENGAEMDHRDKIKGFTALHYAAASQRAGADIIELLHNSQADMEVLDPLGRTAPYVVYSSNKLGREKLAMFKELDEHDTSYHRLAIGSAEKVRRFHGSTPVPERVRPSWTRMNKRELFSINISAPGSAREWQQAFKTGQKLLSLGDTPIPSNHQKQLSCLPKRTLASGSGSFEGIQSLRHHGGERSVDFSINGLSHNGFTIFRTTRPGDSAGLTIKKLESIMKLSSEANSGVPETQRKQFNVYFDPSNDLSRNVMKDALRLADKPNSRELVTIMPHSYQTNRSYHFKPFKIYFNDNQGHLSTWTNPNFRDVMPNIGKASLEPTAYSPATNLPTPSLEIDDVNDILSYMKSNYDYNGGPVFFCFQDAEVQHGLYRIAPDLYLPTMNL